jgi:hypothetical protein
MVPARVARSGPIINPGYDLFHSVSAAFDFGGMIGVQAFQGVPLGTFNFGGMIGVQNVGNVDTIVRRIDSAQAGMDSSNPGKFSGPAADQGIIDIELVALNLQSVNPIDIGAGAEFISATLFQDVGSEMRIGGLTTEGDPHGTFDSILDFLVKLQGLTSGLMFNVPLQLVANAAPWRHQATGGPVIAGVNFQLNGMNDQTDFWPIGMIMHTSGNHSHTVENPEPATLALAGLAGIVLGGYGYRRRKAGTFLKS